MFRSQARLEKLGDQLGSGATGAGGDNQEDPSINVVSDGEITNHHLVNPQNETQNISSANENKTPAEREKGNESIQEGISLSISLCIIFWRFLFLFFLFIYFFGWTFWSF